MRFNRAALAALKSCGLIYSSRLRQYQWREMLRPRAQPLLDKNLRGNLPSGDACLITQQKHGQTFDIIFYSFTDANRSIEEADWFILNATNEMLLYGAN